LQQAKCLEIRKKDVRQSVRRRANISFCPYKSYDALANSRNKAMV